MAVNCFDGAPRYAESEIREALAIAPETPLVMCDARVRESVKQTLISLVEYVVNMYRRDPSAMPVG